MKRITFILEPGFPKQWAVPPIPAKEDIPEWYRNGEAFINKNNNSLIIPNENLRAAGMKSCMPYFDALTSGYFLTTWADIEIYENKLNRVKWRYVKKNEEDIWVEDQIDYKMVGERFGDIGYTMPRPSGYSYNHMIWKSVWGMKLPKGWSMMVTHPHNRYELPFITVNAFMDSDRFTQNGSMPFFIKENWTGIIEKGTPYAQLIPIKRQPWVASTMDGAKDKLGLFFAHEARKVNYGYYRSKLWVQKVYKMEKNEK